MLLGDWLLSAPSTKRLKDRSARVIVCAATPRKLQTKLTNSANHRTPTPRQPVPALTPQRQTAGRVATRQDLTIGSAISLTRGGRLNHSAAETVNSDKAAKLGVHIKALRAEGSIPRHELVCQGIHVTVQTWLVLQS